MYLPKVCDSSLVNQTIVRDRCNFSLVQNICKKKYMTKQHFFLDVINSIFLLSFIHSYKMYKKCK